MLGFVWNLQRPHLFQYKLSLVAVSIFTDPQNIVINVGNEGFLKRKGVDPFRH